jgi:transposase-like protein
MMTCRVCRSKRRKEIDRMLVDGASLRDIARRFSLKKAALHRHQTKHLPALLTKAKDAATISEANSLLQRVERIIQRCEGISAKAEKARDWQPAVSALNQIRACCELLAQLTGELKNAGTAVNVSLGSHVLLGELSEDDVWAVKSHRRWAAMTPEELTAQRKEMLEVIEGSKDSPVLSTVN